MWADVICVTNGIKEPASSWTINDKKVPGSVTIDEWTFKALTANSKVDVLDAWHSAATGRLNLSAPTNETVTLRCRHRLADGSYIPSEPFLCT